MNDDFEPDLRDRDLAARLSRATAADRPSEALLARVREMARESPGRLAAARPPSASSTPSPARPPSAAGEFWRELFPRLVGLAGVASLLLGALGHFSLARGIGEITRLAGSLPHAPGFPAMPGSVGAPVLAAFLVPLVVLLFVEAVRGGPSLRRWLG